MKIKIRKLHPGVRVPTYGTEGAACFDLYALEGVVRQASATVDTGIAVELPPGHALFIKPRSGMAFNSGLQAFAGTVDSDYRGQIRIMVTASDPRHWVSIKKGDRVAQAMVLPVPRVEFEVVDELAGTGRAAGGFGSTGA